jgi:hypothetical protein
MADNNNLFLIPKDSYVAFDANSLRELIVNRLNEQNIFTDQNFVGSNVSAIIDIVSYAYNTLIYYLNRTSSESMFTEAQLYENMNRIVKLIDYSPIGYQTSTLSFNCSATNFNTGVYTIPRYSYVVINNIPFSFNEDIIFVKTQTNTTEYLKEISEQKLLYQGIYQEYPIYTAIGENNEIIILNTGNELVDHFNIDVYVRENENEQWTQYTQTTNLYLENNVARKYEIRLNGNKRYEIKFGNDINGRKLHANDQVAIYYLQSLGNNGVVGAKALSRGQGFNSAKPNIVIYKTSQYDNILNDVLKDQYLLITNAQVSNFTFDNNTSSTFPKEIETVDEIRNRAPAYYRFQYRLVTTADFETFVSTNFANIINDVKVINNWEYTATYLKYFYDIGIQDPSKTDRALLNQVLYADACNFNNVYLIIVPKSNAPGVSYMSPAQKELINTSMLGNKITTTETVFIDPIYKYITLGLTQTASFTQFDPITEQDVIGLEIIKRQSSRRDDQTIVNDIVNIFKSYFAKENSALEQVIDVKRLNQLILGVDGVLTFYTYRIDNPTERFEGLSLFIWNPNYSQNDKIVSSNNIQLAKFEFPYFNNIESLYTKIKITSTPVQFERIEY